MDNKIESDPLEQNVGKICRVFLSDGRKFVAKLAKIEGGELYFQIRDGRLIMNRRDTITSLTPLAQQPEVSQVPKTARDRI